MIGFWLSWHSRATAPEICGAENDVPLQIAQASGPNCWLVPSSCCSSPSTNVEVSEVFHYAGGPFNIAVENPRGGGRDPQGRSYASFAAVKDPDGNGWLLQEIKTRLPGRVWKLTRARTTDVATLA